MKIINKTAYQTKVIRTVLSWTLKKQGLLGKNLVVEVGTSHRSSKTFIGGYAYYGRGDFSHRNFIYLKFPKEIVITKNVVDTFSHELAHTRGIHHSDLLEPNTNADEFMDVLPLTIPKKACPVRKDPKQLRYENAISKVKAYQTKLKRTNSILKKWQKKVSYYKNKGVELK